MRTTVALLVTMGLWMLGPTVAEAHDLTCSTSRFSHWPDLKRAQALVADDKPRVECVQVRRNVVRIIGGARSSRYVVKQTVVKTAEKTYGWPNSPFYYDVRYWISRPVLSGHGWGSKT